MEPDIDACDVLPGSMTFPDYAHMFSNGEVSMYAKNQPPASQSPVSPIAGELAFLAMAVAMASLGLGGAAASAQPSARQLTVQASGFAANNGHAVAKLFVPGADVLKRGNQEIKAEIRDGKATFVFPALPAGEYAVVVFHDANDNGVIDHNRLGLPSESLGFSNAFRLSLTAGLPSFEKLRFSHGAQAQSIAIAVE